MKITHNCEGKMQIFTVAEELGHHEAAQIIEYMDRTLSIYPDGSVILDLSALTFMDSSGLAVVLHLQRELKRQGRGLLVRGTRPQAMRVFRAAGLPRLVNFEGE